MSELVKFTVDGKEIEAAKGSLLIDSLLDRNIHIPHFCYHQALGKDGNCRMCMVEIEGQKRPQIACDTPVKEGMVVRTKGDNIEKVRRDILEMELINHPIDCPTCDQAGECKLQDYYMESGFYHSRVTVDQKVKARKRIELGSNVMLDQERCVLCTRCVRFCSDITGTNELGVINRADHSVIGTFPGKPLDNPYAMNVVDLCPVGALTSQDFRFKQRVWFLETFDAICNGCSRGCNITVDHRKEKYKDDQIFRFKPRVNREVNGWFMCDEGRLSYKKEAENRFETALIDNEESLLDNAITKAFKMLTQKDKILFVLDPNLSLEEMQNSKNLAKVLNANITGYSPQYFDESFGDDYLRKSDKSANRAAFKELEIDESEESFNKLFDEANIIVILGNNYFDTNLEKLSNKKVISFFSHKTETISKSNIAIPTASFYEKSGTYINFEGKKQKVISKIRKNSPKETITSIIEYIKTMIDKGNL
ncbi:2Fe-2S iron-sulfur cluster-binding protein [Halarcobacter anaerophilus]|uniref:NADH-quinone oxidoreductase subunit G n=1 Tax=Halarcobacter anaerophilus TaxID=877500 RepID=A0A4Q0XZI8_9BACT|nr:2Fe-2S iron-sulfur cluster-binding protein [Halarcobacter anaerophilus]QDF29981.1 NADH:quinone oxidoreductase I, chain G [Halarcobacter anaerophilus]RXJ63032.1 NADH-quinone oxidoreductase subunit G [Halarcobacter anaerophilus]